MNQLLWLLWPVTLVVAAGTYSTKDEDDQPAISPEVAVKDSMDADQGERVFRKMGAGAIVGFIGGLTGTGIGLAMASTEKCVDDDPFCGIGAILAAAFVGATGYTIGTAVGVSRMDPRGRFFPAFVGSSSGMIAGLYMTAYTPTLWPSIFVCPIIMSTMMSEGFRAPPKNRRLSFGLAPNPQRGLSASATLRF